VPVTTPSTTVAVAYTPTELQALKLQLEQKDLTIIGTRMQAIKQQFDQQQAEYQKALGALQADAEKIKVDNKWPKTLVFDAEKLTFSEPPPPPAPAANPSVAPATTTPPTPATKQ
jgi:hypothetical protein